MGTLPGSATLASKCNGEHVHQHIENSTMVEGHSVKRSLLSRRYPKKFCTKLAAFVTMVLAQAHSARSSRLSSPKLMPENVGAIVAHSAGQTAGLSISGLIAYTLLSAVLLHVSSNPY